MSCGNYGRRPAAAARQNFTALSKRSRAGERRPGNCREWRLSRASRRRQTLFYSLRGILLLSNSRGSVGAPAAGLSLVRNQYDRPLYSVELARTEGGRDWFRRAHESAPQPSRAAGAERAREFAADRTARSGNWQRMEIWRLSRLAARTA